MSGQGLPPVGSRRAVRVSAVSPEAVSPEAAREQLDVPSLSGDNLFTGTNEFDGAVSFQAAVQTDDRLTCTQGLDASGDPSVIGCATFASDYMLLAGGLRLPVLAKSADYTAAVADLIIRGTGTWTLTLPTAVGIAGKFYVVKNSGAGTITLATSGGETIDGGAPGTVAAGAVTRLVSDGTNWFTI